MGNPEDRIKEAIGIADCDFGLTKNPGVWNTLLAILENIIEVGRLLVAENRAHVREKAHLEADLAKAAKLA